MIGLVVFFGVGEWRGWYLGVPAQTPMFIYKKDHVALATRRTINTEHLPFEVSGKVQRGNVKLEVLYELTASFQNRTKGAPERSLFEQVYTKGQTIAINERFEAGKGIYRVRLTFSDATGLFSLKLPTSSQL
ncbi:MAG: hypothetical protein JSV66_03590 [Trueperaceae bacterium]|nr:MAG: hypothetical protein JSV66_03590 [Trueperaceae bacterium]